MNEFEFLELDIPEIGDQNNALIILLHHLIQMIQMINI